MNIHIDENGCMDMEVAILDTKLPYYYARVRELFTFEPEQVQVILIGSKAQFCSMKGSGTDDCDESAFIKGSSIYIYEPNQFGVATSVHRKDFYKRLYEELVHLFYTTNRQVQHN
jgi:hypothetical protein